jgi:antirestriction protein ArdC
MATCRLEVGRTPLWLLTVSALCLVGVHPIVALKGYAAHIWMPYRRAAELGGQVRKGEHGSAVA